MKKITKIRIAAIAIAIVHFALSFFVVVVLIGSSFVAAYGDLSFYQKMISNIFGVLAYILSFPLYWLFPSGDMGTIFVFALNSILWGFIFYYFMSRSKESEEIKGYKKFLAILSILLLVGIFWLIRTYLGDVF